jgi:hypothetical protein
MDSGIFDRCQVPSWLTVKQAMEIESEIEGYILREWGKKNSDLKKLSLSTDQHLKLLRCKAEDMIFEKYGIDI